MHDICTIVITILKKKSGRGSAPSDPSSAPTALVSRVHLPYSLLFPSGANAPIGVGAQSTLWGHDILARRICMKK